MNCIFNLITLYRRVVRLWLISTAMLIMPLFVFCQIQPDVLSSEEGNEEHCSNDWNNISVSLIPRSVRSDCGISIKPILIRVDRNKDFTWCSPSQIEITSWDDRISHTVLVPDKGQSSNLSIPTDIEPYEEQGHICFDFVLVYSCLGITRRCPIGSECIDIRKEGDIYCEYVTREQTQELKCFDDPKFLVTCNGGPVEICYDKSTSFENSTSVTVTSTFGNFEVNGVLVTVGNPLEISTSTQHVSSEIESKTIRRCVQIDPTPGYTMSLGVQAVYRIVEQKCFRVGPCDTEDIIEITDDPLVYELARIEEFPCQLAPCSKKKVNTILAEFSFKSNSSDECVGDIKITPPPGLEGQLEYSWTGPTGETNYPNSNCLENVPAGQYTVTITDECCIEYIENFYLCEEPAFSDWTYNEADIEYCREKSCPDCPVPLVTECINPDIETIYDNDHGTCTDIHTYEGEELNTFTYQANIEWEEVEESLGNYDCIGTARCGDNEFDASIEDVDVEWAVDEFLGAYDCVGIVECGDDEFEVEIIDVDVDWEVEESFGDYDCVGIVECGDDEFEVEINDVDVSWEVEESFGDYDCVGIVECGDDEFEVEINDVDVDWDYDISWDGDVECEGILYCNSDEFEVMIDGEASDWEYDDTNFNGDCERDIFCNDTYIDVHHEDLNLDQGGQTSECEGEFYWYVISCGDYYITEECLHEDVGGFIDPNLDLRESNNSYSRDLIINYSTNQIEALLNSKTNESFILRLYDITGRLLRSTSSHDRHLNMDVDLPTNIYIIHVLVDGKLIHIDKKHLF